MRIGILDQQISEAAGEAVKIEFQGTPIYGGQAYEIPNFGPKKKLIDSLFELDLIDGSLKNEEIDRIFKFIDGKDNFELSANDYSKISALVNQVNTILPIIKKVTTSFAPKQDEQVINIKLPDGINNLDDLNIFNNRLADLFKQFGITNKNGLIFQGFDNGSEWYQVLIDGPAVFKWVLAAIGIAWSCLKMRKQWFDTEISRLTLEALKEGEENNDLTNCDEIVKKVINVKIGKEIDRAIENGLEMQGKNKAEVKNQLAKAVNLIILEMDNGTEFHLSLTPPKYLTEHNENGFVEINYSQTHKLEKEKEKTKKLPEPKK